MVHHELAPNLESMQQIHSHHPGRMETMTGDGEVTRRDELRHANVVNFLKSQGCIAGGIDVYFHDLLGFRCRTRTGIRFGRGRT